MYYNPLKMAVHKYMSELLKEKYSTHQQIIERVSHYLATETDVRDFGSMIADIYQMGYLKASDDYLEKLAQAGIHLEVTHGVKTKDAAPKDYRLK